jgi:taurine--2-oxoglutarate transaminase
MANAQEILDNNLKYTYFSWSKQAGLNPINAVKAEGVYIYDRDGKKYLDFSSQLMNANIGHGDKRVADAVYAQMQELEFVFPGMATEPRGALGKKLAEIAPGNLTKTFFTLGGSEAVENAIKLARVYTGRHKIIANYRSYHGATMTSMSAGGDPRKFAVDVNSVPNILHVENPYFYRCPWHSTTPEECAERAANNLEQVVKYENPASVAAIIMEGESGSSGCIKYPADYMKRVRALCDKYGILFIDDETMSGFGRTGKMFAIEHHGVQPDIMICAKGLTSGYLPLGAMITTDTIAKHFDDNALPLGLTYSGHATSCAAALANIKIIEEENLVAKAAELGEYVNQKVEELKAKHPSIGDFRNTGLLGCIELVRDKETKEPLTPWNAAPSEMEPTNRMAAKIKELGMFTFVRWNWIFIAPPLISTKEQIDEGMEIISKAIEIADEYYIGKTKNIISNLV